MIHRNSTHIVVCGIAASVVLAVTPALAQDTGIKPASNETKAANAKLLSELPFANRQEFEDAKAVRYPTTAPSRTTEAK